MAIIVHVSPHTADRPRYAPKRVYWVSLQRPEDFKKRYAETGGGLFSNPAHARARGEYAIRAGRAVSYTLHEAETDWRLADG